MTASKRPPACVIVVENLPVPFDRRVWQEACALRDAGWHVTVICPATRDYPRLEERIDGIDVLRHPLPVEAKGKLAFLAEYGAALFHEMRLLLRVWARQRIDVIQGCNPPDLIFLVAAPFRLFGTKFVFDHHDICPELFEVKFGRRGIVHRALMLCEWLTFKSADAVISTNETFRSLAIGRGGLPPERVQSVYSFPDRSKLRRVASDPALRGRATTVLGYVGIIGDQDGVDRLVRATHDLVQRRGHDGLRTIIVGDGPAAASVRALARELQIEQHIVFTGYLRGEPLLSAMSSFDIAVIPDPPNVYNDKISMNKVFEYSTLGIPTVAYALTETMRLFGDAALYAREDSVEALAQAITALMADPDLRARLAALSTARAAASFDWSTEALKYVAIFDRLVARDTQVPSAAIGAVPEV